MLLGRDRRRDQQFPAQVIYSGPGVAVPATFAAGTFASPWISPSWTPTINVGANTFSIPPNNGRLARAETFILTTTGTPPPPLVAGVSYPVTEISPAGLNATSFKPGGVTLTGPGTGTHTIKLYTSDLGLPPLAMRIMDSAAPTWARMHTADGTYNWVDMDEYVAYHCTARGRKLIFCFNQTPTWLAPNSALDAYGYAGGGQVPTNFAKAAEFITAFLGRYGSHTLGIELWNEPSFFSPGTATANWCGTMAQLAEFGRVVSTAVKAVSPSYLVLGPGFTVGHSLVVPGGTAAGQYNWLLASDGAGRQGKDWIDGICYHGYDASDSQLWVLSPQVKTRQAIGTAAGLPSTFPMYQTERGIDVGNHSACHVRFMAVEAALGVKMSVVYAIDFYGDNPRDNPSLRSALGQFYAAVSGKTITYCAIEHDGSVTVTADGVTWNW